jgi:hypothetical protein
MVRRDHGKSEELVAMAEARSREKGIPFDRALSGVAREHPELAEAARTEVLTESWALGVTRRFAGEPMPTLVEAGNRLAEMVKARSREKNISLHAALLEIGREHRELAHAAREEALGMKVPPLGGERGAAGSPASSGQANEELARMAETRAREKAIDYGLALSEIARENPELVRSARQETLGIPVRARHGKA